MTTPDTPNTEWLDELLKDLDSNRHAFDVTQVKQSILKHYISYDEVDKLIGDIELRADIDDELLKFVPDMHERSLEVTGVPSSFTNLYTRGIVKSVQAELKAALKKRRELCE